MHFNKTERIIFILLLFILSVFLTSCKEVVKTTGKKALLIIAPENFRDEELFHTKETLEKNGIQTFVASKKTGLIKGSRGSHFEVSLNIKNIKISDYDAIVFIGGPGTIVYLNDPEILNIAKKAKEENKVIGAICLAPSILANAELLNGVKATAFRSEENNLKQHGALWQNSNVVQDGKIITGNGPLAAYKFGETIANELLN